MSKLQFTVDTDQPKTEIQVKYGDKTLIFCASVFLRRTLEGISVFEPVNSYIDRLSLADQHALWEIYEEFDYGFSNIFDEDELIYHLKLYIQKLVTLIPLQQLETWIAFDPTFIIPADAMEVYLQDVDNKNTREKTYLRSDYIQLVALAVFVRFLMPIFGEYIEIIKRSAGVDMKEFYAAKLLTDCGVLKSQAAVKLSTYISKITEARKNTPERILNGVSTEDIDFLLLSLVLVRKLGISDIRGDSDKANLVSVVFTYIYQKVVNPQKTDLQIREKKNPTGDDGSGESKRSQLESYRKRAELSLGEIAAFSFGYEHYYHTAKRLAPDITEEEVMSSLATAESLKNDNIGDPQRLLMAFIMKHIHSPATGLYISPELLARNLGVVEAVLWHWGFRYLAILATSVQVIDDDTIVVSPVDTRAQIPADLKEQIVKHYPLTWSNLRRNNQGATEEPNPILNAIDLIVEEICSCAWHSTASKEKIHELYGEVRRRLVVIPTLKIELAKLLIFLEERPFTKHPLAV